MFPPWSIKFYQAPVLPTLGACLRQTGFNVTILDPIMSDMGFAQIEKYLQENKPKIVGVSIPFTGIAPNGVKLLKLIKEVCPNTFVMVGGYHAEIKPEEFLDYCNVLCHGSGEKTIVEIMKNIEKDSLYNIDGIMYKKNGKIIKNKPRDLIDIDEIPPPAWDLMPMDKHKLTLYLTTKEPALPLQTGRGCPFRCTFCCNSKTKEKVRYRKVENIIKEIKEIKEKFNIHGFHMWDETFTLNKERTVELCKAFIENNLDIRWSAQTRAGMLDQELLDIMIKAGCNRIGLGIEAGDPRVLKSINKMINLEDAKKDIALINKNGIVSFTGFMIGHPDDDIETIANTIKFADEANAHFVKFKVAMPYPGCVFRDIAEKKGKILTNDWAKYDERSMTYIPEALKEYDLHKIQHLATAYFYWQNSERIARITKHHPKGDFLETLNGLGPWIYNQTLKRGKLNPKELIKKFCKIKD